MTDDADRAATALIAAFRTLAASQPGKHQLQAAPGVISLMSGLPIGTLNGAFTDAARPAATDAASNFAPTDNSKKRRARRRGYLSGPTVAAMRQEER